MKKILIIIVFIALSITAFSQGGKIERDVLKAYEELITDSTLEVNGEIFNWGIGDNAPADGNVLLRSGGIWTNGSATGTDSTTFDITNGYAYSWFGGVKVDSTLWDDRYLLLEDTVDYVQYGDTLDVVITPTQLSDSLDEVRSRISGSSGTIILPINGTLDGSVIACVEGVNYPDGWILTADDNDLKVYHGYGKYTTTISVKSNVSGDTYRQLRSFDNAYSGVLDTDNNNFTIEGLTRYYTGYIIRINISFE